MLHVLSLDMVSGKNQKVFFLESLPCCSGHDRTACSARSPQASEELYGLR